jgi:hypothetical protein
MAMKSRRPGAGTVTAAMCVALLASETAHAAASQVAVALEYSAEGDCPQVSYFKAVVVERLGADAFAGNATKRVIVHVTSHERSFEGRMEWRDAEGNWAGERTFPARGNDCDDLVRAMAFTLALQLQFSVVPSAPSSVSATVVDTDQTTVAPPSPPAAPARGTHPVDQHEPPTKASEQRSSPLARPLLTVGAGTLLQFGTSSAVPFARVFGGTMWPNWSLELSAEVSLPTTVRRSDGAGFSQWQAQASAAGCRTIQWWSACLLTKVGEVRIAGKDIDVPASAAGPIVETGFRVRASQRIFGRAYASASAEVLVLPVVWAVTLDHSVVWTSPRFAQAFGLDVALRFE